ncbi:ATPase, T2SS/T4P/T4SS family [Phycicoccus sp. SLBN-51]|uniref:ATPase, T2SS/T4P/T4SS family n=1 Tax=Phycicoccus sp. SLBN-51 TaxID=2768447 RepID=UPI00114E4B2D|nr:ATPase, T2SS/T4P/T4SS family [Phycicoccus sp. SLBN-51]TQJ49270.1 Flp pilus assembly CpaF family ATPase [Phycicoccus sp. SLBN-51]
MGPLDAGIREAIRRGRAPAPEELDELVAADTVRLGTVGAGEVRAALGAALLGAGPLEPHLRDPLVTDVLVNGDGSVWLDRGDGLEAAAGEPLGPDAARLLAVRLAGQAGRRLDESQPWVDGLLPGGVRLHAVLPPLVDGGAHLSLRVPRRSLSRLDDLEVAGMFDAGTGDLLRRLVERRVSFLVTGGTGSGKTTLLGALLAEVPGDERVVLVEDVRELSVAHPHVVRLQSRSANVEGAGEVTLVDLVRQALRMRPDRLVVGEVRSPTGVSDCVSADSNRVTPWRPVSRSGQDTWGSARDTRRLRSGRFALELHGVESQPNTGLVPVRRGPVRSKP